MYRFRELTPLAAAEEPVTLGEGGTPLVVAVDDTQWVDSSSASALAFALRRLRSEHILLLLARRLDECEGGPAVEEALEPDAVERLRVGPLSIGAIHTLLQRRLGRHQRSDDRALVDHLLVRSDWDVLELARLSAGSPTLKALETELRGIVARATAGGAYSGTDSMASSESNER